MFSPCIPMYFLWLLWISILYVSMRSGVFAWTISNISRFTERKNGKIVQIVKFVKLQKIFLLEKKTLFDKCNWAFRALFCSKVLTLWCGDLDGFFGFWKRCWMVDDLFTLKYFFVITKLMFEMRYKLLFICEAFLLLKLNIYLMFLSKVNNILNC